MVRSDGGMDNLYKIHTNEYGKLFKQNNTGYMNGVGGLSRKATVRYNRHSTNKWCRRHKKLYSSWTDPKSDSEEGNSK